MLNDNHLAQDKQLIEIRPIWGILFLLGIHTIYLYNWAFQNKSNFLTLILVFIIGITVSAAYYFSDKKVSYLDVSDFLLSLLLIIGAVVCYILNVKLDLGSVVSTGFVGLMASFVPKILSKNSNYNQSPTYIYCGAFIGMCSYEIAGSISFIIISASLSAIIYCMSKNVLVGYGGKLGTIAFGGVYLASLIFNIL